MIGPVPGSSECVHRLGSGVSIRSYRDLLVWRKAMDVAVACHRRRRDFARFLSIARGSLAELDTHIRLAQRLGYVDAPRPAPILAQIDEVGRLLNALRNALDAHGGRHRSQVVRAASALSRAQRRGPGPNTRSMSLPRNLDLRPKT